ncbi:MAG: sulfite exporter TauE/SafE family protein [Congregibacter sp.]|nr:sulfite exporter TauE/SafE family protein [Congregibacter sp.]
MIAQTFAEIGLFQMLVIWVALVFASLLRAFTGFGFALAAMPVLALFVTPTDAVVVVAALTLATNLLSVAKFWPEAPKRPLVPILLMSVVGTAIGAQVLAYISVRQFQLWIGLGVIAACIALTFLHPRPGPPRRGMAVFTGLVSGLMNGALAIPGPPVIVYVMATQADAHRSRAMLLTYFMLAAVIALCAFALSGYLTVQGLILFVLGMPAMLIGDRMGLVLFVRFGTQLYRRIALGVLYAVGISITLKALVEST